MEQLKKEKGEADYFARLNSTMFRWNKRDGTLTITEGKSLNSTMFRWNIVDFNIIIDDEKVV